MESALIVRSVLIFTLLHLFAQAIECGFNAEYYKIKDSKMKKQVFMDILYPLIDKAQQKILVERDEAIALLWYQEHFKLKSLAAHLDAIAQKYRIKKKKDLQEYLRRIDIVPDTLVLAQAAAESGWGSSRFVKKANNLFGEWTWGEKGLVPNARDKGKKHKIRIFQTLQDSIDSYMLNLNRHYAYKKFRQARYQAKLEGKEFKGKNATKHLDNYSGIGSEYHDLLQGIIKYNKMCEYSPISELLY